MAKSAKGKILFDKLALDVEGNELFTNEIKRDDQTQFCQYPLIIRMVGIIIIKETTPPEESEVEGQIIYSYFKLVKPSGPDQPISSKLLYQKVEIGYDTWVLKTIFGQSMEGQQGCTVDNLKDDCCICFAEKVDIVALPCRHLSIGFNCANTIRETKKHRECSVCRMRRV